MRPAWLTAAVLATAAVPAVAAEWAGGIGFDGALTLNDGDAIDRRAVLVGGVQQDVKRWSFVTDLRGELDLGKSRTLPNGDEQATRSSWNRIADFSDRARLDLRNAFATWRGSTLDLRLGKQPLVWGNADGVQVLDVLAPRNYRAFVLEEPIDSRISLWSGRATWRPDDVLTVDGFLIADPTVNVLPSREGVYEFTSPRYIPRTPDIGIPVTLLAPGITDQAVIADLVAPLLERLPIPEGLEPTLADPAVVTDRPSDGTLQGGVKAGLELDGADVAVYYAHLRHRNPRYTVSGSYDVLANRIDPTVTLDFVPADLLGLSGSMGIGPYILRGETTYTTRAPLAALDYPDDGRSAIAPEVAGLLALDRMLPGNWFVSSQLYFKEPIDDAKNYDHDTAQRAVTALLQSDAFGRWPQLEVFVFHSVLDRDWFARVQLRVRLRDDVGLVAGTDVFAGDHEGVVGQYRDLDRVYLRAHWTLN